MNEEVKTGFEITNAEIKRLEIIEKSAFKLLHLLNKYDCFRIIKKNLSKETAKEVNLTRLELNKALRDNP
jgi:hydrogenase maturation factor